MTKWLARLSRALVMGFCGVFVVLASDPPQWLLTGSVVGALAILSAVSAVASAFLAKLWTHDARAHVV